MKPDSNFILSITPNYAYGRRQGFTDEETEKLAEEAYSLMQIAEEKQVPKKPERLNAFRSIGKCGGCERVISTRTASVYCQYCGNKVDWGNEDEA